MDAGKTQGIADSPGSAATLDKEKREEFGIGERRLLLRLEDAQKYLDQTKVLRKGLGDNFVTKYLAVNEVRPSRIPVDSSRQVTETIRRRSKSIYPQTKS